MKIVFSNKYGDVLDTYTVEDVCFDTDDIGIPVDIEITCNQAIADDIAEKYCTLGYNYAEEYNCALFGRLKYFYVEF